jgi:hypothetical protein
LKNYSDNLDQPRGARQEKAARRAAAGWSVADFSKTGIGQSALATVKWNNNPSPGVSIPDSGPPSSDVFHPLSAASVPTPGAGRFIEHLVEGLKAKSNT